MHSADPPRLIDWLIWALIELKDTYVCKTLRVDWFVKYEDL